MYKLINKQTHYEMFRHDGNKYNMIGKFKSNAVLAEFCEVFAPIILPTELVEATRYMVEQNHNVAEFGYNGTFTVSYVE